MAHMNANKVSNFVGKYVRSANWRRKAIYIALLVIILLAGGHYWYSQSQAAHVPQEFYDARGRAAEISSRIVQLTDASVQTLRLISAADEAGNYRRGLTLVTEEVDRNKEIKNQAVKLSEEVKTMALNLGVVKPEKAASVGLRAATTGLELAQRLVNYNNYAQELLAVLQTRFKSSGSPETRQRIEQIILRMNQEAETINNLNERYQEQIREFDKLVKQ